MADYLIQDTTLDAIADAINAKTGGSSAMTPAEMVTAIGTISGGGGWTTDGIAENLEPSGDIVINAATVAANAFTRKPIVSVSAPNVTEVNDSAFQFCTLLRTVYFPSLTTTEANAFSWSGLLSLNFPNLTNGGSLCFNNCKSLQTAVLPKTNTFPYRAFGLNQAQACTSLQKLDLGGTITNFDVRWCSSIDTLIFRKNTIVTIGNVGAFDSTPFASGGTGGTIYIPKVLYDHLGDGTSLDYKAATNWSTIDGYGTIAWAQIEGSIYETQYADGTPITTA